MPTDQMQGLLILAAEPATRLSSSKSALQLPVPISSLLQDLTIKFRPVFHVVEVNCISRQGGIFGQTTRTQDLFPRFGRVEVTPDGRITRFDCRFIDFCARLLLQPSLKLKVGWPVLLDEVPYRCRIKIQGLQNQ